MDSVSQFALGAAVSVAVMGQRMPLWRSALWGGVCGTLPDLDALIDHGDALSNMVLHRAHTHALAWQTLVTPLIAYPLRLLDRWLASRSTQGHLTGLQPGYGRWCLMVWLALITHALLDGFTVYGTRLALPFSDQAYGLGSIFIIDPLYTLPLIVGLVIAVRSTDSRGLRANSVGLALSTLYLCWSAAAQLYVGHRVSTDLASGGSQADIQRVLITPAPFTTVLWRVLVMRDDRYEEGFYSLLDGNRPIRLSTHPIDPALRAEAQALEAVRTLDTFSDGFIRIDERQGVLRITDLRMGQEPGYVFSFLVARRGSALAPITPQSVGSRGDVPIQTALDWLWRRAAGADIAPPR